MTNLRTHTLYITLSSLVLGFLYSRMLASSVASLALSSSVSARHGW